jgi:hypothetical protein
MIGSQRSFASGEIAPALHARADLVKYATGLKTARNFTIARYGGAQNRAGFEFIAAVKDSTKTVRLIEFIFNADQAYVLEFGDLYIRFFYQEAPIEVSAVTAWSNVTAYVIGDLASDSGTNYYAIQAGTNHAVSDATYWYPLTGTIYEIPSPYVEADLATLQFEQSADVMTIVHPSYAPRSLSRLGQTDWTLAATAFAPSISAPANATNNHNSGSTYKWKVTAIKSETLEESLPSSSTNSSTNPATATVTVSWDAVSGAQEYNVYRAVNGIYGFIGTASSTSFDDDGVTPDISDTPPIARTPFGTSSNYPSTTGYFQQRQLYANTNTDPEKVWASRTGNYHNLTYRSPLQDDDAITFIPAGRQVNEIRHLLDLGKLVILTAHDASEVRPAIVGGGHQAADGDADGVLRPTAINLRSQGSLSAIYVQARGSIVRDLRYDVQADGYNGNELTIFSPHLVDGYEITDIGFAQTPQSIVWCVRDDGTLLGCTYVYEQQVLGWHRHDTGDGDSFEDVCVIPEGSEDGVYVVVNRTINGTTKRYIERLASRSFTDIKDAIFVDSCLSYDGRNTASTTLTLSGSGWTIDDDLTLTASASTFVIGDIGNAFHLNITTAAHWDVDEYVEEVTQTIRLTVTDYSSATVVTVRANKTVPAAFQGVALTDWAKAVDVVTGLTHLEGRTVSIFADGNVVSDGHSEPVYTVSSGTITLPRPYTVIRIGLPITADLETLDLENPQGESITPRQKIVNQVTVRFDASRGGFFGPDVDHLTEIKQRGPENWDEATRLFTGPFKIPIDASWNSNGRVFIRQSDPLPISILSIHPNLIVGG